MRPPTHDEMSELAAEFAQRLLELREQLHGCDRMAYEFALHAVGTVLVYRLNSIWKAHPEAEAPFKDTLMKTVARLPKPGPHRCPECDEDAAEERKDRRGE